MVKHSKTRSPLRSSQSLPVGLVHESRLLTSSSRTVLPAFSPVNPEEGAGIVERKARQSMTSQTHLPSLATQLNSAHPRASFSSPTNLPSPTSPVLNGPAKLHKRGSSASSVSQGAPLTPQSSHGGSPFTAHAPLYATLEEPPLRKASSAVTVPLTVAAKAKAYRHRRSLSREDQGKLDLSKSTADNFCLAGLGIQEVGVASNIDGSLDYRSRQPLHLRTQSASCAVSRTALPISRASQPFVHPMRQVPKPFTASLGGSYASSINEDDISEGADVIEKELYSTIPFRNKRSMSMSSIHESGVASLPRMLPTDEMEKQDARTMTTSASQSNLSSRSELSTRPQSVRPTRSRRGTDLSVDQTTIPSSRTSLDKAMSFVSRRTSDEPVTRDERIREARRKFDEREAEKDRKVAMVAAKRRQSDLAKEGRKFEQEQRRSISDSNYHSSMASTTALRTSRTAYDLSEKVESSRAAGTRSTMSLSSLRQKREPKTSVTEKAPFDVRQSVVRKPHNNWLRFSGWLQTRIMNHTK